MFGGGNIDKSLAIYIHAFVYILCHRNADEIDEPQPNDENNNDFEESLLDFSYMQQ